MRGRASVLRRGAYRRDLARKAALADLGATGRLTRAHRPHSNGKAGGQPPVTRVNNPAGRHT
ncbi:hypothetical protein [Streptomyces phaeoluteigriseus]|uniref:hypothetical protein n=1 Tax=Streptomyces phaeoluteigriseus TaxID=114686 RepID=UPI00368F2EDC